MPIIDQMKAALQARADVNGDGKVTRADLEEVARKMAAYADAEVKKFPWAAVIAAAVLGATLAAMVMRVAH